MRRLHVPRSRIAEGRAALTPEARHYLCSVLRLAPGAQLEVFDGEGGVHSAVLGPTGEELELGERQVAQTGASQVWLAFALAKGEKNDLVVQKATELGAARLLPWEGDRSVVKLQPDRARQRVERWERIAAEAARQCGRADVPVISAPAPLGVALTAVPDGYGKVAFYEQGGEPLREILASAPTPGWMAVVGPEGGFTPGEISACAQAGCRLATLGPRILRAETAAIAAVVLLETLSHS